LEGKSRGGEAFFLLCRGRKKLSLRRQQGGKEGVPIFCREERGGIKKESSLISSRGERKEMKPDLSALLPEKREERNT